jgi:type I restriction enzyme S subunit
MRFVDKSIYEKESILIPRKGTLNNIMYQNKPFWAIDTMFWSKINQDKVFPKFLYYQLTLTDYTNLNVGSAVPSLTVQVINEIEINLPSLEEQIAIASVLSSLDDKIDLLHRQNATLEKMAETLFRQWFVEDAKEEWETKPLGSLVTVKRGGSPRPIQNYLSDTGLRWLKISDATKENSPYIFEIKEHIKIEGFNKTTHLKAGTLVLSNSATPGIAKILQVDTCIHDGWLHFPKSHFSNEFLYLLFKKIRPELLQQGNGSIFTNLKTDILKEYPIPIADNDSLLFFDNQVKPIFIKILKNQTQIRTLTEMRDTLLPKLMCGELTVGI